MQNKIRKMEKKARWVRNQVLEMIASAGKGHIGGAFSSTDILVALYYGDILRFDPSDKDWDGRDRFILSKGHSGAALYAILAVMRQAVDNFNLEQTADRVLSLFGTFNKQWTEFKKSMGKVGVRIKQADDEYEKLTSRRSKALERPLRQIDDLRRQRGILESPLVEDETALEISDWGDEIEPLN